jgi:hypothetical protein
MLRTVDVEYEVAVVDAEVAVLCTDGEPVAQRRGHLDQYAPALRSAKATNQRLIS